jgi:hypothetical protein
VTDMPIRSARLGIDFGTSHTIAMIGDADRNGRALLFEGSPLLPSAVFAADGELVAGRFALQQGRRTPASLEPHPKRRIDADSILLGEREVDLIDAIAAVLTRVRAEATRVAGALASATITVPATWGPTRRQVVAEAAERAGLGAVRLVPEPVAAAAYFVRVLGHRLEEGGAVVVYDLGAGTFDATVVARRGDGFAVLAQDGRDDLGGLDIDAAIADHLRPQSTEPGPDGPRGPGAMIDQRGYQALLEEIRLAKESLSTYNRAEFADPLSGADMHLTRSELEDLARPLLAQTVKVTGAVIAAAGLAPEQTAGVFLVGGASRMPLAVTMLHQALGLAPTAIEQPELIVAEGSLIAEPGRDAEAPASTETPRPVQAGPDSTAPLAFDYRPRPVGPQRDPERAASSGEPPARPRAARRRAPGLVVAAAGLLAVSAVPCMSMWGAAIETAIAEGALDARDEELLFGATYPTLLALSMFTASVAVPLLLRRVRWAPALGVITALVVAIPVLPVMTNAAVRDGKPLLGLFMVAASLAAIVCLLRPGPRDWFAAPRADDGRTRARRGIGIAAQAFGAVAVTVLLELVLHGIAPDTFW